MNKILVSHSGEVVEVGFWVIMLYGLVGRYQCFGGTYCLYLQTTFALFCMLCSAHLHIILLFDSRPYSVLLFGIYLLSFSLFQMMKLML
jgi:hypothetical protein